MKKLLLILALTLTCSYSAYAEIQEDVINSDAISFDNVPSGVDGSIQYKSGSGFGSDTNFFFDANNISLGIGTNDPTLGGVAPNMRVFAVNEANSAFIGAGTYSDTPDHSSAFFLSRFRGTLSSPAQLQDGDDIGSFLFYGANSVLFGLAAEITVEVCGSINGNKVPGCIDFMLQDGVTLKKPLRLTGNYPQYDCQVKPTCDSATRGAYCHNYGGVGVKDSVEVCAKDAGDAYAWRILY